jgi:hypothetical protein
MGKNRSSIFIPLVQKIRQVSINDITRGKPAAARRDRLAALRECLEVR